MLSISASGQELSRYIKDEIERLTSRAWLVVASLKHDETQRLIRFTLERVPLKGVRRGLLGLVELPEYDNTKRVTTSVTVRHVEHLNVRWGNFESSNKERIHIERGVLVGNGALVVVSAEELRGTKLFELSARLGSFDVEVRDQDPDTGSA